MKMTDRQTMVTDDIADVSKHIKVLFDFVPVS